MLTHSSEHSNLSRFSGKHVVVLGAGASSFDLANLLNKAGATVEIVARRRRIDYNSPPSEHRLLLARLKAPRSGLGTGWRSRMCSDMPLLFHAMPQRLRLRAVKRHLGPEPCLFVMESITGRVPVHVGATIVSAHSQSGRARLIPRQDTQEPRNIDADHIIAATGYRVALCRLKFIDNSIQEKIRKIDDLLCWTRIFSLPSLASISSVQLR